MTDEKLLRAELAKVGAGTREAAGWLGISKQSFLSKIQNVREFKASEIYVLREKLNLSPAEQERIFFAQNVGGESTSASAAAN